MPNPPLSAHREPDWHLALRCYRYDGALISIAGYEAQGALTRLEKIGEGAWNLYIAHPVGRSR